MSFAIYAGTGERHDRIDALPEPPPWRRFDGEVLDANEQAVPQGIGVRPGDELRAASYRADPSVAERVNTALHLRKPLLVTGRPGVGKSSLALSIAWELQLGRVLHWPITSRVQMQHALYRYDALGQLQEANLRRAVKGSADTISAGPYLSLGPLGTAFVGRSRPRVLLIDEFDKGDIDLPNDLLALFDEGQFAIPELIREGPTETVSLATADGAIAEVTGGRVHCLAFPVIVITSNGERAFPDAFLRRCVQVDIPEPTDEQLRQIVRAQLGDPAFERASAFLDQCLNGRREEQRLRTDQLLNACYLVVSGAPGTHAEHLRMAQALVDGGAGRGSR